MVHYLDYLVYYLDYSTSTNPDREEPNSDLFNRNLITRAITVRTSNAGQFFGRNCQRRDLRGSFIGERIFSLYQFFDHVYHVCQVYPFALAALFASPEYYLLRQQFKYARENLLRLE